MAGKVTTLVFLRKGAFLKIIPIVLCASMALNACTAMLWEGTPTKATATQNHRVGEDELFAWAQTPHHKQGQVAIVGKQATYVLKQGKDDAMAVAAASERAFASESAQGRASAEHHAGHKRGCAAIFRQCGVYLSRDQPSDDVYYALHSRKGQKLAGFEIKGKEVVYSERILVASPTKRRRSG